MTVVPIAFRMMNTNAKLLRMFAELAATWWRADRVRISPREGELLRLRPGAVITVRGAPVEIVGKSIVETATGPRARYACLTERGPACLEIRLVAGDGRIEVGWSVSGRAEPLTEHAIGVFG